MDFWIFVFGPPAIILFVIIGVLLIGSWITVYLYCFFAAAVSADKMEHLGWPIWTWVPLSAYLFLQLAFLWTFVSLKLAELMGITNVPW